jgi:hypothetical protein
MNHNNKPLESLLRETEDVRLKEAELLNKGEEILSRAREIARSVQARVHRIAGSRPGSEGDQNS